MSQQIAEVDLAEMGMDAQKWADAFYERFLDGGVEDQLDHGTLIAWFANAIEAGRSAGVAAEFVYRTLDGDRLPWDEIRETATSLSAETQRMAAGAPIHESLLRSYHVVREVKAMLDRGDSPETVRKFIEWAEAREAKW